MPKGWHVFIIGDMVGRLETLHGVVAGVSKAAIPKVEGGSGDVGFGVVTVMLDDTMGRVARSNCMEESWSGLEGPLEKNPKNQIQ
jgi:hypothetical protein